METALILSTYVEREEFLIRDYIEVDDVFALVVEGSFRVVCGEETFIVEKNDGFLFRRQVFYHRDVLSPVKLYLFRYKGDRPLFNRDYIHFRDSSRILSNIQLLESLRGGVSKNEFEYHNHIFNDFVLQCELETIQKLKTDPIIEQAVCHLEKHLENGVDLIQLAKESGFSYVHFLRRFKAYTGMTPSDYVISLRLQKAKKLLSDTNLLIREIAFSCGFENEYYFSNFFKKHTAYSPSAFRDLSKVK